MYKLGFMIFFNIHSPILFVSIVILLVYNTGIIRASEQMIESIQTRTAELVATLSCQKITQLSKQTLRLDHMKDVSDKLCSYRELFEETNAIKQSKMPQFNFVLPNDGTTAYDANVNKRDSALKRRTFTELGCTVNTTLDSLFLEDMGIYLIYSNGSAMVGSSITHYKKFSTIKFNMPINTTTCVCVNPSLTVMAWYSSENNVIYIVRKKHLGKTVSHVETIYLGDTPLIRRGSMCFIDDEKLIIGGGLSIEFKSELRCIVVNITTSSIKRSEPINYPRSESSMVLYHGKVHLIGGKKFPHPTQPEDRTEM